MPRSPRQLKNERRFYPIVLAFLKENGYLTEGLTEKGSTFPFIRLGKRVQADVAGIKDIGTQYSQALEIAAVEVKDGKHCKVRYIEQALGYSIFAHNCYLAMPISFSEEDKNYAKHMGVGLLEINENNSVTKVFSPETKISDETKMMYFMRRSMNLVRCVICGSIIHRYSKQTKYFDRIDVFGKEKTSFVCGECFRTFKLPSNDSEEIKAP